MEPWTDSVGLALEAAHTRALPFSTLRDRLLEDGVSEAQNRGWFLEKLRDDAHGFRVIVDRMGPWLGTRPEAGRWRSSHQRTGEDMPLPDPWVLALSGSGQGSEAAPREDLARKIREALRVWGQVLDEGSPASVARWIAAVKEAEGALASLLSPRERAAGRPQSTTHPQHPSLRAGTRGRWRPPPPPQPVRSGFRSRRAIHRAGDFRPGT